MFNTYPISAQEFGVLKAFNLDFYHNTKCTCFDYTACKNHTKLTCNSILNSTHFTSLLYKGSF